MYVDKHCIYVHDVHHYAKFWRHPTVNNFAVVSGSIQVRSKCRKKMRSWHRTRSSKPPSNTASVPAWHLQIRKESYRRINQNKHPSSRYFSGETKVCDGHEHTNDFKTSSRASAVLAKNLKSVRDMFGDACRQLIKEISHFVQLNKTSVYRRIMKHNVRI